MKRNFESSSTDEERSLGERIADKCYEKYDQLLTGGKPSAKEWTHLASFVRFDETRQIDVLSIGTGTKCLGGSIEERGTNGCLVHDSHAEVLARRSLMRLLYEEILSDEPSDLLTKVNEKYRWNRKWTLALFTSSVPCGLASHRSNPTKKVRTEGKVLGSIDDGQYLSLKPGKGSSTQSLSCTDKIKRWLFQGSLLNRENGVKRIDHFQASKADFWIRLSTSRSSLTIWLWSEEKISRRSSTQCASFRSREVSLMDRRTNEFGLRRSACPGGRD